MTGLDSGRLVPRPADVLDGLDGQIVDKDLLGLPDVQHRGFEDHLGFSLSELDPRR